MLKSRRGSVTSLQNAGVFLSRARQQAVFALFQHPASSLWQKPQSTAY
jgi:predicted NUDIX family NTP pyrophosphohydrolase